jgi:hypothetical protein
MLSQSSSVARPTQTRRIASLEIDHPCPSDRFRLFSAQSARDRTIQPFQTIKVLDLDGNPNILRPSARPIVRRPFGNNSVQTGNDSLGFQSQSNRQIQIYLSGKIAAEMSLEIVEHLKESPDVVLAAPSAALPVDLTKKGRRVQD